MITLSATRAFKAYHFEVPHNLSKNINFFTRIATKHYRSRIP